MSTCTRTWVISEEFVLEPNLTKPSALHLTQGSVLECVLLRVGRSFEPVNILTIIEKLTQPGLHMRYRKLQ